MSDNLINFFPCNYTVSCIVTATIIATDFVAKKKYAWHFIFEPRLLCCGLKFGIILTICPMQSLQYQLVLISVIICVDLQIFI